MDEGMPMLFPVEKDGAFTPHLLAGENHWKELQDVFLSYNVTTPLCLFPPALGLEPLFYYAARAQNLPVSAGTAYNLNATVALVHLLQHDAVVTTRELLHEFVARYRSAHGEDPLFLVACVVEDGRRDSTEKTIGSVPITVVRHPLSFV